MIRKWRGQTFVSNGELAPVVLLIKNKVNALKKQYVKELIGQDIEE